MVQRNEIFYFLLEVRRQIIVGRVLIRKQRVAALLRHLDRVERGAARRHLEIRIVGVEVGAGVGQADRLTVLLHVRQDEDVGMLGMVELIDDVRLWFAELAGKAQKFTRGKALVAENQNLRGEERIP